MDNAASKALFLEQAAAYDDELERAAQNAPYGKVLAKAEEFAVTQGRELLRMSLETIMQGTAQKIDQDEKKEAKRVLAAELDAIAESRRDKM